MIARNTQNSTTRFKSPSAKANTPRKIKTAMSFTASNESPRLDLLAMILGGGIVFCRSSLSRTKRWTKWPRPQMD